MTIQHTSQSDHFSALERLHERVNAMLDTPTAKDGDEFPLPLEATLPVRDARRQPQARKERPQ